MTFDRELKAAFTAAEIAGKIQLENRQQVHSVELKSDSSPVTAVDKKCENEIRELLGRNFPDDGFLGEETGCSEGTSGRKWIVDPLDGTRPYLRGIPTFSVLVALEDENGLAVGVIHLPALGETYSASRGRGSFCNGKSIHVSSTPRLSQAMGSAFGMIEKAETPEGRRLLGFMSQWDYTYGFMDAYSYACTASGKLDACVNIVDRPWDCAAAACIVKEAGGKYSDIYGNETVHNGSIILSNSVLHDSILSCFK